MSRSHRETAKKKNVLGAVPASLLTHDPTNWPHGSGHEPPAVFYCYFDLLFFFSLFHFFRLQSLTSTSAYAPNPPTPRNMTSEGNPHRSSKKMLKMQLKPHQNPSALFYCNKSKSASSSFGRGNWRNTFTIKVNSSKAARTFYLIEMIAMVHLCYLSFLRVKA